MPQLNLNFLNDMNVGQGSAQRSFLSRSTKAGREALQVGGSSASGTVAVGLSREPGLHKGSWFQSKAGARSPTLTPGLNGGAATKASGCEGPTHPLEPDQGAQNSSRAQVE